MPCWKYDKIDISRIMYLQKSLLENVFRSANLEAKIINHRLGVTKMAGKICIRDMMTVIGTKETVLVHNNTNIWSRNKLAQLGTHFENKYLKLAIPL